MAYLRHIAVCERCSDLLAQAMRTDGSDAAQQEEAVLAQLKTATLAGQQRLAAMMFAAAQPKPQPRVKGALLRWPILL